MTTALSCIFWPQLPHPLLLPILVILAILLSRYYYAPIITGGLFGIVWMASVGHWQTNWQLPVEEISNIRTLTGEVVSIRPTTDNAMFTLKASQINGKPLWGERYIRLSWRLPDYQLKQGFRGTFVVKLKPVNGLANLGGFRYQQWLVANEIAAIGYVKSLIPDTLISDISLRHHLIDKVLSIPLNHQGWLLALTFGERGYLSNPQWQLIQNTGIAHLIAISGLHLGIVAVFSYWLFMLFMRLLAYMFRLPQQLQYQWVGGVVALVICYFYAVLAGLSLPTIRAIFMLALLMVFNLTKRKVNFFVFFCLSVFLFILLWPLSILSLSFWLSFGAIAAIGFVIWRWPQQKIGSDKQITLSTRLGGFVFAAIRFQLVLGLLMMPMVASSFSFISVHSLIVNIIAVPVVTLVLVPLCLLAVFLQLINGQLSNLVFYFVDELLGWCLAGLTYIDTYIFSVIELSQLPVFCWMLITVFLCVLFLPLNTHIKAMSCLFVLPAMTYTLPSHRDSWFVHILDVGQGLSVVIQKNQRAIVYDVGPQYSSGFNMADSVIIPFLKASNIRKVDWVVISHFDNDHAGSLAPLFRGIAVSNFASNKDRCIKGWKISWQGLMVQSMWPTASLNADANDSSCVVMVSDGANRVLLTGDISKAIEYELIQISKVPIQADVLVAGHHGSNTSSSSEFINAVDPKFAVFSQGYMNRWKFPSQAVVDRFVEKKVKLFATSDSGQISFEFVSGSHNIKPYTHREHIYKTWYNRAIW
ncbi:DNA internalization-related competence protein ComEC/Rec2 [Aliiglaciecola sp.]|nr:DNA internalization-related competence protein ComEC/Rec2 [Aliiglaciecola sp.]